MQRSYSRIVQPGGDRIRLQDLPIFGLHHQRARPVDDPFASQTDRRRGTPAVDPLPAGASAAMSRTEGLLMKW